MTHKWMAWCGAAVVTIVVVVAFGLYARTRDEGGLRARMAMIVPIGNAERQPCQAAASRPPLVILALGQSNAANHGPINSRSREVVTMVTQGQCITARDPLPGATGDGGSIWSRLIGRLSSSLQGATPASVLSAPRVMLALLAVDGSSIEEWTRDGGPLRERLLNELEGMTKAGLAPNLILWQQGEADAMAGRSTQYYATQLDALASVLTRSGVVAPVMLARSTRCRSAPSQDIRAAIEAKVVEGGRWLAGPDTDTLTGGAYRHDDCHFSSAGLDAAAQLWATAIVEWQGKPMGR